MQLRALWFTKSLQLDSHCLPKFRTQVPGVYLGWVFMRTASGGRPHLGNLQSNKPKHLYSHRYTPPGVSYILMLFNLAICPICPMGSRNVPVPEVRSPYTLHAHRMHAEYPFANLDDDVDLE